MSSVMKTISLLVIAACLIAGASITASAEDGPLVLGYYPAWVKDSYPAEAVDFSILTHLIHAFAWPDSVGNIEVWEGFHYPELITATHAAGRKISVAFGGWGQCEGFPPVAADPKLRADFIKNALDFCDEYGYDGVDLDWEFPANPTERANQSLLVDELRKAANKRGKPFLLTMAISAGSWSGDHNDYGALVDNIDWFNDMTYDFYGTWTDRAGHNTPLYATQESVNSAIMFLTGRMKIPPEKVLMGLAFYGRKFNASELYGPSTGGGGVVYRNVVKTMSESGWKYNWDDVSKVPYLTNAKNKEIIFYDNPESIAIKCDYAKSKNLRGVMIWSLGSDYMDGKQPLLSAIGKAIK